MEVNETPNFIIMELKAALYYRETWANQVEVFLSVLGYIIGLGNIWRFPYMAFENGGGKLILLEYHNFVVKICFK